MAVFTVTPWLPRSPAARSLARRPRPSYQSRSIVCRPFDQRSVRSERILPRPLLLPPPPAPSDVRCPPPHPRLASSGLQSTTVSFTAFQSEPGRERERELTAAAAAAGPPKSVTARVPTARPSPSSRRRRRRRQPFHHFVGRHDFQNGKCDFVAFSRTRGGRGRVRERAIKVEDAGKEMQ